ncbi:uncharacterized protein LOC135082435 [Ostrinia nubilalis]|uniref:uncharacterized protein LOC135082435 n=1 Tax=Ostrinia nubilalis TaxID=29057 RepID=UPI00308247CD
MRIRAFCKNIEVNELEVCNLKNCTVVIDGQNYFYRLYQDSKLPYQFGCESNKYADYLRDYLSMFKKANVKCYILFKGGNTNGEKKTKFKETETYITGLTYEVNGPPPNDITPVFMKCIYREVLDEMGIDYVICEFESKKQCIALAQKLKCPIISYDIEFAFSGRPYIPYAPPLHYNDTTGSIECGIFILDHFMRKNGLTREILSIFVVLTDEQIFTDLPFQSFFEEVRLPLGFFKRNAALLRWLSRNTVENIKSRIIRNLTPEDQNMFSEEQVKIFDLIGRIETPGEPVNYLLNGKSTLIENNDPQWFEKGVITKKIALVYVNMYHSNNFYGSWCIEDPDADDALFLSIDIIKYAYNLLTNYQRNSLRFMNNKNEVQNINNVSLTMTSTSSVQKPPCCEENNILFGNGWDGIKDFKLFDFFLKESLPGINLDYIKTLPEDARLVVLSLIYFCCRKKENTMTHEAYSILLSYVMLGVVLPKIDTNNNNNINGKPNIVKIDKDLVTLNDCDTASTILAPFFELTDSELENIFDKKLIHPFVEFQHCLEQMNNLNRLCDQGDYQPTIYHKTYNGTFVYKFFYSIKNESRDGALHAIKKILTSAPTVLNFYMSLVKVCEQTMTNL